MTSEEIRFEYWLQLNEELDRIQAEYDSYSYPDDPDDVCFECEVFNNGKFSFDTENSVRFVYPDGYFLGARILEIFQMPDVVWCNASVHAEMIDGMPELIISVVLRDG